VDDREELVHSCGPAVGEVPVIDAFAGDHQDVDVGPPVGVSVDARPR